MVIHLCKRLRTCLIGMVRPASASRTPSSIAASVFSSSSSIAGAGLPRSNSFALVMFDDSPHWRRKQRLGCSSIKLLFPRLVR
jgi:hypothetical protein